MVPYKPILLILLLISTIENSAFGETDAPPPQPAPRPGPAIVGGYRAITIYVAKGADTINRMKPGTRVNILWDSNLPGKSGTTRIVENARIISNFQESKEGTGSENTNQPDSVTLLVSDDQANRISLALKNGTIRVESQTVPVNE